MMEKLRAASNHVVLKVILALIILSFVLTGVGNFLIGHNGDYAVRVNGQEISQGQLENALASERTRQQQVLGEQFSQLASNEGYLQQIRQQALSQLIDETLLEQYAKQLHLSISDEQVRQAIFSQPAFQSEGKFDNKKYLNLIAGTGFNAEQYAEVLRKQLVTQQLIAAIANTDFMLDNESSALAALISQQRMVRTATIPIEQLAMKQQANDQEIQDYYQQHKSSFLAPEQFRVSYLQLDVADIQSSASENEIRSWYADHKSDFGQPQRNRYSFIQSKTEAEARSLLAQLKKGADFAALAKAHSVDPITGPKGGDMGWLEPSTTPDEFKQAGLTSKGQLSSVISSTVGFLLVRLDDIQPEQIKPLAEVQQAVADKVKREKSIDAYYKLQQSVSDAASNDSGSLESAEQAAKTHAKDTGWFDREHLPTALDFKPVAQAIFSGGLLEENGAPGSNSDIITVDGDRAFVLRIRDHKAEAVRPFAEVRSQIIDIIRHNKALKQARSDADTLLAALNNGDQNALKAAGLSLSEAKTLSRDEQNPVTHTAFTLPPPDNQQSSWGSSEDQQGNIVIIALDKIQTGTIPEGQKREMVQGVIRHNAQITFAALLSDLRKEAKINFGAAARLP